MGAQAPNYRKLLDYWRERRERILRLAASGMSQTAIARQLGVSRSRVNQIVRAAAIPSG